MSQENSQEVSETVSEQPTTETTDNSTDVSSLVAESKKYRKRSQDAESRLAELEKKLTSAEEAKLKEKEDFKALYEKVSSENEALDATAQKWNKYEENRRNTLLEAIPEDEREKIASLDLDTLEYVTDKINNQKINVPEVVGRGRNTEPPKDINWADPESLKDNWGDILESYKNKRNLNK